MIALFRWTIFLFLLTGVAVMAQNSRYHLVITPPGSAAGVVMVDPGGVVQFSVRAFEHTAAGTSVEVPITSVQWNVDPASFGSITAQGLFTAAAANAAAMRGKVVAVATIAQVTIHASVDVALRTPPGQMFTFSGNVHAASGPLAGAQVSVMGASNLPFLISGKTDAQGNFHIQAPAGTYIVRASAAGHVPEYFDNAATATQAHRFTTDPNTPSFDHIDFLLDLAPQHTGSIAGTVTDGHGAPIAHVAMTAWINGRPAISANTAVLGKAVTAADGSYLIERLPPGDYLVRAAKDGFIPEFFDDAATVTQATPVTVTTTPVHGIDFALDAGGSISGTVIDEHNNTAIPHATVIVRSQSANVERGAKTDAHGRYTVTGLPSGSYIVFASAHRFTGEYHDNVPTAAQATRLTLIAPAGVTDIDFALAPVPTTTRSVNGTVTGSNGVPPEYVIVEAIDPLSGETIATSTDALGAFELGVTENAILRARAIGHVGLYAGGTRDWSASQWSGAIAGVNFTLDAVAEGGMATFHGSVQDAGSGSPLAHAWVHGFDTEGNAYFAVTAADGSFRLTNAPNGEFEVLISEVGYDGASTTGMIENANGQGSIQARRSSVTSTGHAAALPDFPELYQNYPNPFNPSTTISFAVPERMVVRLRVHDLLGRTVATIANGMIDAGTHRIVFDATRLPSGIYLARLETIRGSVTRRMVISK